MAETKTAISPDKLAGAEAMNNVMQMVDHHAASTNVLADIQKQAQLISDLSWSATITKSGKQYEEVLQNLKLQNETLQQLFKQL